MAAGCSSAGGEAWLWAEVRCSEPSQIEARITLPVGSTGLLRLPAALHGIGDAMLSEGGRRLNLGPQGTDTGLLLVSRALDHAGRSVRDVEVGSGSFAFFLKPATTN